MLTVKYMNIVTILVMIIIFVGISGDGAWAKQKNKDEEKKVEVVEASPIELPPKLTPDLVEKNRSEALVRTLKDSSTAHWLPTINDLQFLVLHHTSLAATTKGTLLLLPGNEHHPDWPGIIHHLRTEMPNEGWSTLSLALPDFLPKTFIPPRLDPIKVVKEPKHKESKKKGEIKEVKKKVRSQPEQDQKPKPPFEERTHHRINEALNFISSQGGQNEKIVVIAEGLSAIWITHFLSENLNLSTSNQNKVDALVFIGGRGAPELNKLNMVQAAIQIKKPLLDITNPQDGSYQESKQRSKLAKKTRHKQYQRLSLSSPPYFRGQETQLYNRIRGWLKRHFDSNQYRKKN